MAVFAKVRLVRFVRQSPGARRIDQPHVRLKASEASPKAIARTSGAKYAPVPLRAVCPHRHCTPVRLSRSRRSFEFDHASAPMIPQQVRSGLLTAGPVAESYPTGPSAASRHRPPGPQSLGWGSQDARRNAPEATCASVPFHE
jgi:hypothetical protein